MLGKVRLTLEGRHGDIIGGDWGRGFVNCTVDGSRTDLAWCGVMDLCRRPEYCTYTDSRLPCPL
jgi:hypothetical protein